MAFTYPHMPGGTRGTNAGLNSNQVSLSYSLETDYKIAPKKQYNGLRFNSISLAPNKTRQRPEEITSQGEAAAAVTTQIQVQGSIDTPFTFGSNDDLLAGVMRNDYAQSSADAVTVSYTGFEILKDKRRIAIYTPDVLGKLSFPDKNIFCIEITGGNAGVNGYYVLNSRAEGPALGYDILHTTASLSGDIGPHAEINLTINNCYQLVNGLLVKTFTLREKMGDQGFLHYLGCYFSAASLSFQVSQVPTASFTVLAADTAVVTTDVATAFNPAPDGVAHDVIKGIKGVFFNRVLSPETITGISFNIQNNNAALDYGLGSSAAQGLNMGVFEVSGTINMLFGSFDLYNSFINETHQDISFITTDANGYGYVITLMNAVLMNHSYQLTSGQTIKAQFTLEGNPQAGGGTLRIQRLGPLWP